MKLVYAVDKESFNNKDHFGVKKKVESHINYFCKEGIEATLCEYVWEGGYPQIEVESDTDILYFRRIEPSLKLILKLRQLKKISPNLRIIMEIPTYPFVKQPGQNTLKKRINRLFGLQFLRFCVDRIVIIGQPVDKLYHIPTICVGNGVDFDKVTLKNTKNAQNIPEGIHMICVSGCMRGHGYDRLIEGMHQYYQKAGAEKKEKVFLHVVGEGRCLPEYKELAEKYGLISDKIFFYGRKTGRELDEVYDKCDIGIINLGTYRTKTTYSSSLKSKEYAAKGIPMVNDVMLDVYNDSTKKYIKMVKSTEEPTDIEEIVSFYHEVYDGKSKAEIAKEIRDAFYMLCDWKFVLHPVINYIKGQN